jgi:16S rRNA (uracil1498-N3)-methyltransferase
MAPSGSGKTTLLRILLGLEQADSGTVETSAAIRWAAENTDVRLLPYELQGEGGTRELFDRIRPGSAVSVFIGPEGGFEASEVEAAGRAGILLITLGPRILRTETAAMVVLSWLIWRFEIA